MRLYKLITALLLAGCAKGNLEIEAEQPVQAVGIEKTAGYTKKDYKIVIPGTWNYDVDSASIPGSLEDYAKRMEAVAKRFGTTQTLDIKKLRFGANPDGCDICWNQVSTTSRYLAPRNGAEFAYLGHVDFDKVTLEDLMKAEYSENPINGSDKDNKLEPGAVVAVKTDEGNYAKLRIDGYLPLIRGDGKNSDNYHLEATLVVFKQEEF